MLSMQLAQILLCRPIVTPCVWRRGENKIIAVDHLVVFVDDGLIAVSLLVVRDLYLVQGSRRAGSPAQVKC